MPVEHPTNGRMKDNEIKYFLIIKFFGWPRGKKFEQNLCKTGLKMTARVEIWATRAGYSKLARPLDKFFISSLFVETCSL